MSTTPNILSVDVEELFHAEYLWRVLSASREVNFSYRTPENIFKILDILQKYNCRATFFVVGEIAFEKYTKVAAPSYEVAMRAYDKFRTIMFAKKCNVPCPGTFLVEDVNALQKIARDLSYPIVIKPRMKVFGKVRGR